MIECGRDIDPCISSIPFEGSFSVFKKKKIYFKDLIHSILCKLFCGVFEITETLIVCENITEINVLVKNLNYRCCSLNNCTVLFSKGLARGGGVSLKCF